MCLSLQKGETSFKKADEDIVCYKVLVNNKKGFIKSPYIGTPYRLGELKKDGKPVKKESVNAKYRAKYSLSRTEVTVESGVFHTFQFLEDAKKLAIHAFVNGYWGFLDGNMPIVVKCTIPKGTRYYNGLFGGILYGRYVCYGSKQLKVGEEITYIPTEKDIEEHCPEHILEHLKKKCKK